MKRFRTVLAYLPRYRWAVIFGIVSILLGQLLQSYAPQILRNGLRVIENGYLGSQDSAGSSAVGPSVDSERVAGFALAYFGIMVLRGFFLWSMRFYTVRASRLVEADMRRDYFNHLQSLDDTFFSRNRTGDLMSRATSDLEAVRSALGPAVMYITNSICSLPIALAFMFYMDWALTLVALVPLVLIAVVVKWSAPRIMGISRKVQLVMGKLSTTAQENFAGVRVVKAYAKEASEEAVWDAQSREYVDASLEAARVRGVMSGGIRSLGAAGTLIILAYCGFSLMGLLVIGRRVDLATLVAFQAYQVSLVWPMMAIGWVMAMFQRGAAALERIDAVMSARPQIFEPATPAAVSALAGGIEVRNLSFVFGSQEESDAAAGDTSRRPVLRGIDFKVAPGGTLGIVGRTGSGKSVLASLLLHRYPVPRGAILYDGHDLNDLPRELLHRSIAMVPQEAFLFSQSIADNISFGLPESPDLAARVEAAARLAALEKDVLDFPQGFQTRVGERGVTLSGGQKQRVAIARAVLRESPVLILDDCLSAVDARTEHEILAGLSRVIAGRTSIIISHRISAVMAADEILVLEDGAIAARGTHEQLVARRGYYAETWVRQRLEDELGAL